MGGLGGDREASWGGGKEEERRKEEASETDWKTPIESPTPDAGHSVDKFHKKNPFRGLGMGGHT